MPNDVSIDLTLTVSNLDLCAELAERPEGEQRNEFAITAMKIGSLALRQAQGRIDADRVRAEGERLIENMISALDERQEAVTTRISNMTLEKRKQLLKEILGILNKRKVRATYSAVACILKMPPQSIGELLGCCRPCASWVVGKRTGKPTGYKREECHPDLCQKPKWMKSCCELRKCLQLSIPVEEHRRGCDGGC